MSFSRKLIFEREVRSTLSRLTRMVSKLPKGPDRSKNIQDISVFNEAFKNLVIADSTVPDVDANMKKLLA